MSRKRKAETLASVPVVEEMPKPVAAVEILRATLVDPPKPEPAPQLPAIVNDGLMPLDEIAGKINDEFEAAKQADLQASNHRVAAGRMLKEVKARLPRDTTFDKWCKKHIKRSRADIYAVLKLVSNDTPQAVTAAVEAERKRTRDSHAKTKANREKSGNSQTSAPANVEPATAIVLQNAADAITVPWSEVIPKQQALDALQRLGDEISKLNAAARSMKLPISVAIENGIVAARKFLATVTPKEG